MNPDTDDCHPLDRLSKNREDLELVARMDLPISDEAQRALDAIDSYQQREGQS